MHRKPVIQLTELMGKSPPSAPEAEAALLGSMIHDSSICDEVCSTVSESDFYRIDHQEVFRATVHVHKRDKQADIVTVLQHLESRGTPNRKGWQQTLIELIESVPSSTGFPHYTYLVRDASERRRLAEMAGELLDGVYNRPEESASDQISALQSRVFGLSMGQKERSSSLLSDLMQREGHRIKQRAERGSSDGLMTGLTELDEILDGFHAGEYITLGARPSMGKSVLAMDICRGISRHGTPTAFISVEMDESSLAKRAISSETGIGGGDLRRPWSALKQSDWDEMDIAVNRVSESDVHVVDAPGITLERLSGVARRLVSQSGVGLIAIDYLQLMQAPRGVNANERISELSRGIKNLARELNVPLLVLSQLSRKGEGVDDPGMPKLDYLRDSGSLEQDSDVVLFIHREDYYKSRVDITHVPNHEAMIGIAKQRNGPTGIIKLHFDGQRTRFGNFSVRSTEAWA